MSPEKNEQLAAPPPSTPSSPRTHPLPSALTSYPELLRPLLTSLRKITEDRPELLLVSAFLSGAFLGRKLRP